MRKLFFLVSFFLLVTSVLCSQENAKSVSANEQTLQEDKILVSSAESSISLNMEEMSSGYGANSSFGFWDVFRIILVLAFIVGCIYFVLWILRRGMKINREDDPFLRKISAVDLSPGKSVQIITLFDKAYILGVSDDSVNLISEITEKDLVDSMNVYSDEHKHVSKPKTFEELLNIFTRKNAFGENDVQKKSSSEKIVDLLKKQRNRINGDEK